MGEAIFKQVVLTLHQREVLKFIANNGGRVPFQKGVVYDDPNRTTEQNKEICQKSDEAVEKMATELHVINMVAIVGDERNTFELTLTDGGRQVLDQIFKMSGGPT